MVYITDVSFRCPDFSKSVPQVLWLALECPLKWLNGQSFLLQSPLLISNCKLNIVTILGKLPKRPFVVTSKSLLVFTCKLSRNPRITQWLCSLLYTLNISMLIGHGAHRRGPGGLAQGSHPVLTQMLRVWEVSLHTKSWETPWPLSFHLSDYFSA